MQTLTSWVILSRPVRQAQGRLWRDWLFGTYLIPPDS
jgi:hypothetical protein